MLRAAIKVTFSCMKMLFFPHTVITLRYVDLSVTVAAMSARSWPLFEMGDTYHSRGNCELLLSISLILYFLMVRV